MSGDNNILKQVVKGLGQVAEETGKEALKQAEEATESIITGKALLGDIQPMSDQEIAQKKAEDERKKQEEMNKLRAEMGQGRNVEQEMEQIRNEEEKAEEQKKEQEKRESQEEQMRQQQESGQTEMPGNAKREAAKRQMAPHGKKSSQPDPSQMSQTAEFKGKID